MSFSFKTKNSLARLEFEDEITRRTELAAFVRMNATVKLVGLNKLKLKFATENAAIARRIFSILKNLYRIHTEVVVRKNRQLKKKNLYVVRVEDSDVAIQILKNSGMIFELADVFNMDYVVPEELIDNTELMRAYIRGSFLGGGSINDPEKNYHLEFVSHNHIHARDLSEIINSFDLNSKIVKRKENYIVYLKESEQIVDLLNIMGAHNALLEVENIRVMKGMRNNINRIVNCETANLSKTIDAAIRQCENIQIIESMIGIEKLPPNLREVARLRIENQEASLKELGEMLTIPLGKSGVNHRLRKIDKIADELRGKS
jgi:DNA-binding protein WhiA